jgi:hypothetical protein
MDGGVASVNRDTTMPTSMQPQTAAAILPSVYQEKVAVNKMSAPIQPRTPRSVFVLSAIVTMLLLIVFGGSIGIYLHQARNVASNDLAAAAPEYPSVTVPLASLASAGVLGLDGKDQLVVNGQLNLNGAAVFKPLAQPAAPVAGELYFDATTKQFSYYNGTSFQALVPANGAVTSLGGVSGAIGLGGGLSLANGRLSSTAGAGVTSVQGQAGSVTFLAGSGIAIAGTTITNAGVTAVSGTPNQISVSSTSGVVSLSLPQDIAVGSTPTFAGLSLVTALPVTSGGTGVTSLAADGVVVGNGTGGLGSVTAGAPGLCLLSTAGAPVFGSCSGSAAVTSLNGLSGVLTLANATGAGSIVTIDDATNTGTKGIAAFNATNFSVSAGVVNTAQNITVASTPTFAGLTLSSALTVANGGTGTTSLTADGVLVGHGGAAVTGVAAGAAGQCLISTAGAPIFTTCPGSGGVATLDGLAGTLTVANSSGVGSTITIDDATAGAKGIASFNATNFLVSGGAVNTVQSIATSAAPTFAGLSLTGNLGLQAAGIISANTIQQTGPGNGLAVTANNDQITFTAGGRTFQFPTSGPGAQTICTTGISCASGGGQAVILSPGSVQSDNTIGPSVFINKTAAGNILQLQNTATDVFVVANNGSITTAGTLTTGTAAAAGAVIFRDGATANTSTLQPTSLTASRTLTIPNASGTLAVSASGNIALDSAGNLTLTGQVPIANGGRHGAYQPGSGGQWRQRRHYLDHGAQYHYPERRADGWRGRPGLHPSGYQYLEYYREKRQLHHDAWFRDTKRQCRPQRPGPGCWHLPTLHHLG